MNQTQRNVLDRTLWVVAVLWAALYAGLISEYGSSSLGLWPLLLPPVAIVAALYLIAGGRKTE